MTESCLLSELSKFKNNSSFWNDDSNIFCSPYNKILHDPECQADCCSGNSDQQANEFTDMTDVEQTYYVTPCHSNDSILTSTASENQYLYNVNTSSNSVLQFQNDNSDKTNSQIGIDNLGMPYATLCCEKSLYGPQYNSYSKSKSTTETRCNQRSYCKGVTKRKRKRTIFTTEQIVVMEGVFKKRPYVSREERLFLTKRLNISEKTIKIWFQNRRRVTEKRDKDQSDSCHSDSTVDEVSNDYITRLDYIESQINQNTDEYGFVTLDNKALTELVKLIDNVLSKTDCYNTQYENKINENYLMYEPVSPGSSSDDNKDIEDIRKWQPSKPEESLQRLIDIQTVLYS